MVTTWKIRRGRPPFVLWIWSALSLTFICTSLRLTFHASQLAGWTFVNTRDQQLQHFLRGTIENESILIESTSDEARDLRSVSLTGRTTATKLPSMKPLKDDVTAREQHMSNSTWFAANDANTYYRKQSEPSGLSSAEIMRRSVPGRSRAAEVTAPIVHTTVTVASRDQPDERTTSKMDKSPLLQSNLTLVARAAALLPLPDISHVRWLDALEIDASDKFGWTHHNVGSTTDLQQQLHSFDFSAFQNALLYGDVSGQRSSKPGFLAQLRQASLSWLSLVKDHLESEAFSMLWLGCFDGPDPPMVPMVLAHENPDATIVLLHACRNDANMTQLETVRDLLELSNVLALPVFEPRPRYDNDDAPGAWQATLSDGFIQHLQPECDVLVLSPGSLAALLSIMLPPDVELSLARVLQWCEKTMIIEDLLSLWPYGAYWANMRSLIGTAISRIGQVGIHVVDAYSATGRNDCQLFLVRRNMSVSSHNQLESARHLKAFTIANLRSTFGMPESEGIRVFTNTLLQDSFFLACVVTEDTLQLRIRAGILLGCDLNSILARRKRYETIRTSKHRRLLGSLHVYRSNSTLANPRAQTTRLTRTNKSYGPFRNVSNRLRSDSSGHRPVQGAAHDTAADCGNLLGHYACAKYGKISKNDNILSTFAEREGAVLPRWWPHVRQLLNDCVSPFTVLLAGEDLGMVSLRIARKHRHSTILIQRTSNHKALEMLTAVIGVRNVITAEGNGLKDGVVSKGSFTYTFLSALGILKYLDTACSLVSLEHRIGYTLTSATKAALVEVPRLRFLENGLTASSAPECAETLRKAYHSDELLLLKRAVQASNETRRTNLTLLSSHSPSAPSTKQQYEHPCLTMPAEEPLLFLLTFASDDTNSSFHNTAGDTGSIAVAALLNAGVRPQWRSRMLKAYLELPVWRLSVQSTQDRRVIYNSLSSAQTRYGPCHIALEHQDLSSELCLKVPNLKELSFDQRPRRNESTWPALLAYLMETPAEHRNGRFSLFEWGAVHEPIALDLAARFPNATVVSVAGSHIDVGLQTYAASKVHGNLVSCAGVKLDRKLALHMYESPELARYSLLALEDVIPHISTPHSALLLAILNADSGFMETKKMVGALVLSSLTTFVPIPSALQASLAMNAIFGLDLGNKELRSPSVDGLSRFEAEVVERLVIRPSNAVGEISMIVSGSKLLSNKALFSPPLARVDVINHTRLVHHHFDWARDGHKRTYTLRISVNTTATRMSGRFLRGSRMLETPNPNSVAGGGTVFGTSLLDPKVIDIPPGHHISAGFILQVSLTRNEDGSYIPYGVIQSITLIAALRLGLVAPQRRKAFLSFVQLPLYEDMAPWNIAFQSSRLDYIDYDTRDETYDIHVRKVYRILSVLMNYKRTIQDLEMCGPKAKNPYGFSHVSECVKPISFHGDCGSSSAYPVPCDDNTCHSDYISCLRAIASKQRAELDPATSLGNLHRLYRDSVVDMPTEAPLAHKLLHSPHIINLVGARSNI